VKRGDEVRELERKCRILVENMGQGVCLLNRNMEIDFVNDRLLEMSGYTRDELSGKKAHTFLEGMNRKLSRVELKNRLRGKSSTYALPAKTKGGKDLFLSISGVPLFDRERKFNGSFAIISDITERKKLQDKLEERAVELEKEVEKRTGHLVELYRGVAVTEERNRLAQEIHDGLAQTLATSLLKIELCERLVDDNPEKVKRELSKLRKTLAKSINATRQVIFELRLPKFHRTGFATVLKQYLEEFCKKTGIACSLNLKLDESLPVKIQVGIYRIIREAMNNVRKHSLAKHVNMGLRTDKEGNLHLRIEDDGKGFDLKRVLTQNKYRRGFGLMGMEEEAKLLGGTFIIESVKRRGTRIKVNVPVEE